MKLLLTNDDGIEAAGINALASALGKTHDVWIVAPAGDQSGKSHGVTVCESILVEQRSDRRFAVYGTPADCVKVGILGILPAVPDLVFSGINHGANVGTDLLVSGTAAAARQAALMGVRALALSSYQYSRPADLIPLVDFCAAHLEKAYQACLPGTFWNVNAPAGVFSGISVTRPDKIPYRISYDSLSAAPDRKLFHGRCELAAPTEDDSSDWVAVARGRLSVSVLGIWGPIESEAERLRTIFNGLL